MKRRAGFLLFLLMLSVLTGYLLSKASLVGRAGISLFYTQYRFLKVWWQAGLLVLIIWLLLFYFQLWAQRKFATRTARLISLAFILLALTGLYFTYKDFAHNTAHRWLGERFHLGGYLFWVGCLSASLFCLMQTGKDKAAAVEISENKIPPA